jgi:hypothetical protein
VREGNMDNLLGCGGSGGVCEWGYRGLEQALAEPDEGVAANASIGFSDGRPGGVFDNASKDAGGALVGALGEVDGVAGMHGVGHVLLRPACRFLWGRAARKWKARG